MCAAFVLPSGSLGLTCTHGHMAVRACPADHHGARRLCEKCKLAIQLAHDNKCRGTKESDTVACSSQPTLTQATGFASCPRTACLGSSEKESRINQVGNDWMSVYRQMTGEELPTLIPGERVRELTHALGYETELAIVQAGHFGVPQCRRRGLLLGSFKKHGWRRVPRPVPTHNFHGKPFYDTFPKTLVDSLVLVDDGKLLDPPMTIGMALDKVHSQFGSPRTMHDTDFLNTEHGCEAMIPILGWRACLFPSNLLESDQVLVFSLEV